ncbi:UDP-Glycosyltransferase superfamily protein [Forsythia ovata]|uniref:UDP-Glycosyltransferase superfamily protein n=1 Tax=Forsythia ovata TaxID=205694 RepID=A0ABD1Q949_9LAMI
MMFMFSPRDVHDGILHVHFVANDHGSVNCSLAFDIYNQENVAGAFDYVHTESVSSPHGRARMVPKVAATWHGIWHEILHSKLFQDLLVKPKEQFPAGQITDLQEAMPWLLDEIRFFSSYTQYICISNSAGEVLRNIHQLPQRNVHVILKSMELMKPILCMIQTLESSLEENKGYHQTRA